MCKRKTIAATIDLTVGLIPLWLLLPIMIVLALRPAATDQIAAQALLILSLPPSVLFYLSMQIIQISRNRPTIGRKMTSLKIVTVDEQPVNIKHAVKRQLLGIALPLSVIALFNLWPLLLLLPLSASLFKDDRPIYDQIGQTKTIASY